MCIIVVNPGSGGREKGHAGILSAFWRCRICISEIKIPAQSHTNNNWEKKDFGPPDTIPHILQQILSNRGKRHHILISIYKCQYLNYISNFETLNRLILHMCLFIYV